MHPFHLLLLLFALAALVGSAFLVRWEKSRYERMGKARGWRRVRIASIPIAMVAAAIVWIPAGATSGVEGLAVFYGLLLTVALAFRFAAHWLVGWSASPPLSFAESAELPVRRSHSGWWRSMLPMRCKPGMAVSQIARPCVASPGISEWVPRLMASDSLLADVPRQSRPEPEH